MDQAPTPKETPAKPEPAGPLRLYAITSREALAKMGGVRGKLGAQFGHAYLHAYWDAETTTPEAARNYRHQGRAAKIALVVETDAELEAIYKAHKGVCGRTFVVDAGLTVFDGPTLTMVGLGPITRADLLAGVADLKSLT